MSNSTGRDRAWITDAWKLPNRVELRPNSNDGEINTAIVQLSRSGLSGSQIAARLEQRFSIRLTRNAVLSRLSRRRAGSEGAS